MGRGLSRNAECQIGLAGEDQATPTVQDLLRRVLACISAESASRSLSKENEGAPEVVLDIEIDDIRYTLLRSYPENCQAEVHLSPREQEIIRLVARGHPNKVIATVLDISPWTVSTYLRRVFVKLGVNTRAEMIARVLNEDLVSLHENPQ